MNLDNYENELIESEDEILAKAKAPSKREMRKFQEAAKATLSKDKRINIRISSRDLGSLQRRAVRYGMPYQTLIASVLHRYITGDLTDKSFEPVERGNSE